MAWFYNGITVQYSTIQCSTVHYSTLQYITVQYSTVQYSTVQYSTVQYSTVQYSTVQVLAYHGALDIICHYPGAEDMFSKISWDGHAQFMESHRHCTVLYCTVLYCTVLYCTVLYCTVLYCTVLYCTVLYCTVLYCTVLYCTVLYYNVIYCTVLYCIFNNLSENVLTVDWKKYCEVSDYKVPLEIHGQQYNQADGAELCGLQKDKCCLRQHQHQQATIKYCFALERMAPE